MSVITYLVIHGRDSRHLWNGKPHDRLKDAKAHISRLNPRHAYRLERHEAKTKWSVGKNVKVKILDENIV